jgi:hypothetical protein
VKMETTVPLTSETSSFNLDMDQEWVDN